MVFHDIESITDVLAGQRVIVYYIEGKLTGIKRNDIKLCKKALETALEMLEKKNEDILIIKVLHGSEQFIQFDELYKPIVTGAATLFVVNNEGIPLMCEQIHHADSVSNAMESLSTICKLNRIHKIDVSKTTQSEVELASNGIIDDTESVKVNNSKHTSEELSKLEDGPNTAVKHNPKDPEKLKTPTTSQVPLGDETGKNQLAQPLLTTELRIMLPNGNKVIEKFHKDVLLQEVWVCISTTYNLEDFDLKTYNRQAFSEAEYKETLQNLDLYPNGVIVVVVKNIVPFNNRGIGILIYHGFRNVMARTTSVFHYVHELLFWVWNSFFSNDDRPSGGNTQSGRQSSRIQGDSNNQSGSQRGSNKSASKSFGNIHTLRRSDDSDDENNRYNGNSTQQK